MTMLQTCEPQNKLVIPFHGRMDTAACMQIEGNVLASVTRPDAPVVFDLSGVDFVSSSFLRLCIYAQQQARHHGFQVINVNPLVTRVFKIAGLDAMLKGD
jgi:anti-anti-sigma factor